MEKIKDFLYYIGDFLVCVLILASMYFLITWKLDETMPLEVENEEVTIASNEGSPLESGMNATVEEGESREDVESADGQNASIENTEEQSVENDENTADVEDSDFESADTETESVDAEDTDEENTDVEGTEEENTATEGVDFSFSVSAGMTAQDVADGLLEKKIIADSDYFVQKLDEMGLSSSLLIGYFEFEEGMDYEEIIRVLTTEEEY